MQIEEFKDITFIFDFDGTLVHSNENKKKQFLSICTTTKEIEYMKILINSTILTRNEILDLFVNKFNLKNKNLISSKLNKRIENCVLNSKQRLGSYKTLHLLNTNNINWHINSATPTASLTKSVKYHFPFINEKNLLIGSEFNKLDSLKIIKMRTNSIINNIVFVGDGLDDFEASENFKCKFIAIEGGSYQKKYIKSPNILKDIYEIFSHV